MHGYKNISKPNGQILANVFTHLYHIMSNSYEAGILCMNILFKEIFKLIENEFNAFGVIVNIT